MLAGLSKSTRVGLPETSADGSSADLGTAYNSALASIREKDEALSQAKAECVRLNRQLTARQTGDRSIYTCFSSIDRSARERSKWA